MQHSSRDNKCIFLDSLPYFKLFLFFDAANIKTNLYVIIDVIFRHLEIHGWRNKVDENKNALF